MQGRSLTEGSRRAVELARRQAAEWKHPEVLPAHLLWALFAEESHAFELLQLAGVTQANLEQRDLWNGYTAASTTTGSADVEISDEEATHENLPADDVLEALTRDVAAVFKTVNAENIPAENVPTENELLAEVHRLARQTARNEGRDVETSSLHFLAAIIQVDRNISAFLFEFGVTAESFKPFNENVDELTEPMPVSFEIDLQSVSTSEQTTILRILDASANRAREGLRVVEDFVRF